MPVVTVQLFPGRSIEQKRALVAAITEAMVEHAAARPDALHVILQEVEPENWGLAGALGIDREHSPAAARRRTDGRIAHVALVVRDLDAARSFYCDLLGFEVRSEGEFRDGRPLLVTTGGVGLIGDERASGGPVEHIAFEIADLERLSARLADAQVRIVRGPETSSYGTSVYVEDPDANVVELIEARSDS